MDPYGNDQAPENCENRTMVKLWRRLACPAASCGVFNKINSFASPAPQVDFIQALLGELQALREEVSRLQEDNQRLQDRITALEMDRDLAADRDLNQLRLINSLREQIQPEDPTPTDKTTNHLDQLARVMTEDKRRSVSVAMAAKLLCISKERMRQLKPLLLADSRFELGWDRQRGQRKRVVIRFKQFIK